MNIQPNHSLAIVLNRTNYSESDRIVTFLTKDFGKIRAIAKGVRKERSKLAAGVELFSVNEIGFINGKSELATIISSRLVKNYHHFLDSLEKVEFGFSSLKQLNKLVADGADSQYFSLAEKLFISLDDKKISLDVTALWWQVNLALVTGHGINLSQTINGQPFDNNKKYSFDKKRGGFLENSDGKFNANHLKLLKLAIHHLPQTLIRVKKVDVLVQDLNKAVNGFVDYHH